ncbi:MAG: LLM class flavin-dependent oxidoreductase [Candidatus Nanopelagicales bacterium]
MRITYGPWGETLAEMVDAGRRAEAAGAEVLWVPELHRSATISIAALAQATTTAQVGTGIALAFTRSPMVAALEALDIDELSGGRFILGLGTGVQRLNEDWHNARFGKPAPHLRETVRNLREFWRCAKDGRTIDLDGEYEPMRLRGYQRPFFQVRDDIPIYLAAMGPIMTRLAGEIGQGWISHELYSPGYLLDTTLPEIEKGLARSGRSRADFDVVASALCAIDDDSHTAKRWMSGTVGFYASVRTYADFWAQHGLAQEQQAVVAAFRGGLAADDLGEAAPDHMVDAVTLSGTPDEVRAKLAGYEGRADSLKLSPPTHGVEAAITRLCQDRIIDLIAGLG